MPKPGNQPDAKPAPASPVAVGDKAPAFTLNDQDEKPHTLADYTGRWVVLYFYPRDSTPGCTTEACDFRDSHDAIAGQGAVVLGISPDDQRSHAKFAGKHSLPFPLLADHDAAVAQAYGVWGQKQMFGRSYMGIIRTTYLIDPRGNVAARWDKVRVKGHAQQMLDKLTQLAAR